MGGFGSADNRTMLKSCAIRMLLAGALTISACGGAATPGNPEIPPTSQPATTTSTTTTTTSTAPTTGPPATTTTSTTSTTTPPTTAGPLPPSVGTVDDPATAIVPDGATRVFYVGDGADSSVRQNSIGGVQLLFYDVYQPTSEPTGLTVLYVHDGAMDGGYANSARSQSACREFAATGATCVSVEHRRGFVGLDPTPSSAIEVSEKEAERYGTAFRDARNDVAEAWFHHFTAATEAEITPQYVLVGVGSGAAIVADLALATPGLPYDIAGAIVSSGSFHSDRGLIGVPSFPVILQAGLFDSVYPAYGGPVFGDEDMPTVTGARRLYSDLAAGGASVRLYIGAQDEHGFDSFGSGAVPSYYRNAMAAFAVGAFSGDPAVVIYRFRCGDANFGAAGPGVTITTSQFPEFRYEPYETDLEAGFKPLNSLAMHPLETTACES